MLGALMMDIIENPVSNNIGIIKGFLAEKLIRLVKNISIQAMIVSRANICEARMVMPTSSKEPIRSNGSRKAIRKSPALGSLKIASIKPIQIRPAIITNGEICKSRTDDTPATMHVSKVIIILVDCFMGTFSTQL